MSQDVQAQAIQIDTGTTQLLCEIRERVAVITLNRPEARNALSDQLTPALRRMIRERGEDERVGALLITGAGTAFCAGGDVKGMGDNSNKKDWTYDQRVNDLIERERLLTGALTAVRKPTVAALPGAAAGAGLAIALACDVRIAAQSAFVSAGYSKIGLSGDYGVAWLVALAHIKDNLDEAAHIELDAALQREARRLVLSSRTDDHREAVRAFVEKRPPVFSGR